MKIKWLFLVLLFLISFSGYTQQLEEVRENYISAASERSVCKNLIKELKEIPDKRPLELAYLGALQSIWAKHVFNPFSKLKTFKEGTRKIEKAVKQDSANIEIRYLRFSIQKNVPAILGYADDIEEDSVFIRNHVQNISSVSLRNKINEILKD